MEVLDETTNKDGSHMTSAAAFVEGGIQDACDDSCSICLEEFCDGNPSTVTSCKHDFHLQCILEWCQRSSVCPMCLQPIILKDPTSQELFAAVERERSIRNASGRIPAIFHHPTLGDFELQNLPVGANVPDLEERIIRHLAAAAGTGRGRHLSRRDIHRGRLAGHGRPHFLLLSHQSSTPQSSPVPGYLDGSAQDNMNIPRPSIPAASNDNASSRQIFVQTGQVPYLASGSRVASASRERVFSSNQGGPTTLPVRDRAGPSDFQAFSESLKSKWNAVSERYKESFSKSTKGWRDRFFPRNAMEDHQDTENRREINRRANLISHLMENLEIKEGTATSDSSGSSANSYSFDSTNHRRAENPLHCPRHFIFKGQELYPDMTS
ncbi:hypothetical protein MLD38_020178 [Melastoma candidum]|uniref:Uncharacterized protein n=1 Tax=Melastoma candidum TaxID=119954 RepID=A0ACB9QC49_9MYRT|nr:hypothetical protein MLD38_020178 [Melastoma candidum]